MKMRSMPPLDDSKVKNIEFNILSEIDSRRIYGFGHGEKREYIWENRKTLFIDGEVNPELLKELDVK